VAWLCLYIYCLEKLGKISVAYHLCKQLCQMAPKDASAWLNMTNLESRLWLPKDAIRSGKKGLRVATKEKDKVQLNVNLGCTNVDIGNWDEGLRFLDEARKSDPNNKKVRSNAGFCYLAKREWVKGWEQYRDSLGLQWRKKRAYNTPAEPEWDGTPGKRIVLYGEQGIGDQICFASMLEDCAKENEIILDVSPKLESLFRRSFDFPVYGTLGDEYRPWEEKDREFDCSLAMGQIGEYYRKTDESFPRKPFLVADEERVLMWQSLWKTKSKPIIGIGLTGGIQKTGSKLRQSEWEDWLPLLKGVDAHFVSLEYKPRRDTAEFAKSHGVDLKEYPHATLTDDYDDTAALVKSLDCVVSVPTSVWHLSGAVGTPLIALKHCYPCWKTAAGLPFHPVDAFIDWGGDWHTSVKRSVPLVKDVLARAA